KRLFELEVPEIHNGTVEIRAIAREAGSRSKVAVASRQDGLDPVGATVGQRGARVQAVVAELGGEKIDVIPWNDDPAVFVANALSPAQVIGVDIDEEHRIANVTVPERMLSLAIGREGQNARLAARLTGWRIDIRSDVSVAAKAAEDEAAEAQAQAQAATREAPAAGTEAPAAPAGVPAEEAAPAAAAAVVAAAADGPAEAAAPESPVTGAPAAKKPAAAKPAAEKPAAAKPAATKPAATKPAATKPRARKPATSTTPADAADTTEAKPAEADANGANPAKKTRAKKATTAGEVAS